jgi:hypothetical protein
MLSALCPTSPCCSECQPLAAPEPLSGGGGGASSGRSGGCRGGLLLRCACGSTTVAGAAASVTTCAAAPLTGLCAPGGVIFSLWTHFQGAIQRVRGAWELCRTETVQHGVPGANLADRAPGAVTRRIWQHNLTEGTHGTCMERRSEPSGVLAAVAGNFICCAALQRGLPRQAATAAALCRSKATFPSKICHHYRWRPLLRQHERRGNEGPCPSFRERAQLQRRKQHFMSQ